MNKFLHFVSVLKEGIGFFLSLISGCHRGFAVFSHVGLRDYTKELSIHFEPSSGRYSALFADSDNMCFNPIKCKELFIDFFHYNSCVCQPITIRGVQIEGVESFKLLGVHISHDLTWSVHVDYVVVKANRRLCALLIYDLSSLSKYARAHWLKLIM